MNEIENLSKAIAIAEHASSILQKSHVKEYTRADGTVVQAHDRQDGAGGGKKTGLGGLDADNEVKKRLSDLKGKGYKVVDEHHTADGVSVDRGKAEHSHYFLQDDKKNKAVVYKHQDRGGHWHTVGHSSDGSVPKHPTATKYLTMPEDWRDK